MPNIPHILPATVGTPHKAILFHASYVAFRPYPYLVSLCPLFCQTAVPKLPCGILKNLLSLQMNALPKSCSALVMFERHKVDYRIWYKGEGCVVVCTILMTLIFHTYLFQGIIILSSGFNVNMLKIITKDVFVDVGLILEL